MRPRRYRPSNRAWPYVYLGGGQREQQDPERDWMVV